MAVDGHLGEASLSSESLPAIPGAPARQSHATTVQNYKESDGESEYQLGDSSAEESCDGDIPEDADGQDGTAATCRGAPTERPPAITAANASVSDCKNVQSVNVDERTVHLGHNRILLGQMPGHEVGNASLWIQQNIHRANSIWSWHTICSC